MNSAKRLKEIIKLSRLSQKDFAKTIGISAQALNNYTSGYRNVGHKFADSIRQKFPNFNPEWLITGKGNMFINPDEPQPIVSTPNQIKIYGKVAAGKPLYVWDNEEFILDLAFPEFNKLKKKQLFGFIVKGDSMVPRFREGDILISSKYELPDELPKDDDIVITCFKNEGDVPEVNVKKFEWRNKKKNEFTLVPFNTYLRTSGHSINEVMTIFKVLFSISKVNYK